MIHLTILLIKIKVFSDKLVKLWNSVYSPSSKIAVDETMIDFRGRSKLIQYCPMKPIKYGIKAWTAACSKTAYLLQFNIYEGKSGKRKNTNNATFNVVANLLKEYSHNELTVYMDSYFSSPALFLYLFQNGFNCVGMMMGNRKFLSEAIKDKAKTGDAVYFENNELLIMKFKDKKPINILSTIKNTQQVDYQVYDKNEEQKVDKKKPILLFDYGRNMKGVDKNNQISSYFAIEMRNYKWWKSVFLKLLDIVMTNSYILHKRFSKQSKISHKEFVLQVTQSLIQCHNWIEIYDMEIHVEAYYDKFENDKRRRCNVCSNKKTRTTTCFYCILCSDFESYVPICKKCQKFHLQIEHL